MNKSYLQTMDFFAAQEQARRRTFWLVLLFLVAIGLIATGVYFILLPFVHQLTTTAEPQQIALWNPVCAAITAAFMAIVLGLTSLVKILQLRSGGAAVARAVGGVPYNMAGLHSIHTQRLRNVVEEMAIASGCPLPDVFVLPAEPGINAFAAGWTPENAAIAVTGGSLKYLTRDELQGVVAHEFSHILYGDMRVNCRLLATITGLFALSVLGRFLVEIGIRLNRPRLGARKKGDTAVISLAFILIGAAFWLLGLIGVAFGRVIQAAISRQREYLADASAVQFTRNPAGIAGALKKIGGFAYHGQVQHHRATELAHMFFTDFRRYFARLLATHPPLEERIRRIDPSFDGRFPHVEELLVQVTEQAELMEAAPIAAAAPLARDLREQWKAEEEVPDQLYAATPDIWVNRVGRPDAQDFEYARALLGAFPPALLEATRTPASAMALVYALLIDPNEAVRSRQLEYLKASVPAPIYAETVRMLDMLRNVGREAWFPLAQLTLPAIGQLPPEEIQKFANHVPRLVAEDGKLSLFEFCIAYGVIEPLLDRTSRRPLQRRLSVQQAIPDILRLAAVVARLGHIDPHEEEGAFVAAVTKRIPPDLRPAQPNMPPASECTLRAAGESLKRLRYASIEARKLALEVLVECALYDGKVTLPEAEMLRAAAAALGLPVPPVIHRIKRNA